MNLRGWFLPRWGAALLRPDKHSWRRLRASPTGYEQGSSFSLLALLEIASWGELDG